MQTSSATSNPPVPEQKPRRKSPLLIFIHIPKTAGITLSFVLQRQFSRKQFLRLYQDQDAKIQGYIDATTSQRNSIRGIRGHFGYGIHEQLQEQDYIYFTMIREPIARVISHYFFHLYHPLENPPPISRKIRKEKIKLKPYVTDLKLKVLDNHQTRLLVGDQDGMKPEFGQCPSEFLEIAKRHLDEHFAVVGVTERFDETLLVLQKVFGWKMPLYISKNISRIRPKDDEISPYAREAIADINQLDLALYQYANERLDQLIKENFMFFKLRLFWFRLVNRFYNHLYAFIHENFSEAMQKELDEKFFSSS